jgi:hypothetical protein
VLLRSELFIPCLRSSLTWEMVPFLRAFLTWLALAVHLVFLFHESPISSCEVLVHEAAIVMWKS